MNDWFNVRGEFPSLKQCISYYTVIMTPKIPKGGFILIYKSRLHCLMEKLIQISLKWNSEEIIHSMAQSSLSSFRIPLGFFPTV